VQFLPRPVFLLNRTFKFPNQKNLFDAFAGTPLRRAERHGLGRNACLVAANHNVMIYCQLLVVLAAEDPHPKCVTGTLGRATTTVNYSEYSLWNRGPHAAKKRAASLWCKDFTGTPVAPRLADGTRRRAI